MIEGLETEVLDHAAAHSSAYRSQTDSDHKKSWGQFFTGPRIASFMASLLDAPAGCSLRVLDPGAGTGVLGLAAARSLLDCGASHVHLTAVELEAGALVGLRSSLVAAKATWGDRFDFEVRAGNFLECDRPRLGEPPLGPFDIAIGNPPYFKMSPTSDVGGDAPNAYARFMEVAMRMLARDGQLVFIIPRSFAAGYYFKKFRKRFHASATLEHVHVFDSRTDAFRDDGVLQENIIVAYRKARARAEGGTVAISTSHGESDLEHRVTRSVPRGRVVVEWRDSSVFLPATDRDLRVMDLVESWPHTMASLGLEVSTGPVVPFRAEDLTRASASDDTVPLLWLQHVLPGQVVWPLPNGFRKPEHIVSAAGPKLLVPNQTYVLIRRFSAKEDERRLVAGPYLRGSVGSEWLGLENHVNFVHRPKGSVSDDEAVGLAALLNSELVDAYFRIASGNTQVSATELRGLPLPSSDALAAIAKLVRDGASPDVAVNGVLGEA